MRGPRLARALVLPSILFVLASLAPAMAVARPATGRYIVILADDVERPGAVASELARRHDLSVGFVYRHALKGFSAQVPSSALARLAADPRVEVVEPDLEVVAVEQTLPTGVDRIDGDLSGTAKIDGVDDRVDVDVAIIDTGIDLDHPDLNADPARATNCAKGGPFNTRCTDGEGDDDNGHGTHVAGTVGALDNDLGVVGVAPGVRLWAVKVLDSTGRGYVSWIVAGIDWVTARAGQIEVANVSLAWTGNSSAARTAIKNSVAKGIVYAVAAGNEAKDVYGADGALGTSDDTEPASYPEVATMSALADFDGQPGAAGTGSYAFSICTEDKDDSFACFSNFSRSVASGNPVASSGAAIDLMLPGVGIRSTYLNGGYAVGSGTSMASPHGAGLAALHVAKNGRASDAAGVYAIRQALIDGGVEQTSAQGLAVSDDPDPNKERIGWAGDGAAPPPADHAPTVSWVIPANGDTVSGTITIQLSASDADGDPIESVSWQVDGAAQPDAVLNPDTGYWEAPWDTSGVADGSRTLSAQATAGGVTGASASISVTIDNEPDPPEADDPNEMGVFDISWTARRNLDVVVTIRRDSDASGALTSADASVGSATVSLTLTLDSNGDGTYDACGSDQCWLFTSTTDASGIVKFKLIGAPNGSYRAEVTSLTHATYTWDPSLDLDNPDFFSK